MNPADKAARARLTGTPRTPETGPRAKITARDVTTGSLETRVYSSAGPRTHENGPVFVLLHGIGASHRYFRKLQRLLALHGKVHSVDLPGFGTTAKPDRQISVAEYAAVIASTLNTLGTGPVVLVGHSMGTQFATELAVIRPDLVSHVVLIGPVVDPARRTVLQQALALAQDSLRESPSGNAIVFTDYLRCGIPWYLTELSVMMTYSLEARLSMVTQPVLVTRGSRDPIARHAWCRELAAVAANGRLLELPGKPHMIQYCAADLTAAGILDMIGA
jgi:pimeloyl-ACP methyl ester carboxylesterase